MNPEILLFVIKLILGGLVAFCAILVMSKTHELYWLFLICGFLFSYVSLVFELLIKLGVLIHTRYALYGIPVSQLLCATIPSVCFLLALIFFLIRR